MNITDPEMKKKMERALSVGGDLYTLDDIEEGLNRGELQGHTEGDTWAITQVQNFPQKVAVHILFVVGSLDNSLKLEAKIAEWARTTIQADLLTGTGRNGWWAYKIPGWRTVSTNFAKDL
jgi:hypothetical protein